LETISQSGELKSLTPERVWQEMQLSLADGGDNSDINSGNPEVFFQVLKQCNALEELWPDLAVLWGIPNPALWHPEICSGVHTMMVLQQAVLLTQMSPDLQNASLDDNKTAIRFAALCHDLGKGITEAHLLPSHKGHEKAGLPLVDKICRQLKVPSHYKQLALKVCEFHLHCHKAFELKASTLLNMFNQIDIWRKPEEFDFFLIACKADFLGRLGFENRPYPQEQYLQTAALAARQVNAKPFVEQGLKGLAIKEAIAKARLDAIVEVKADFAHLNPTPH